MPEADFTAPRIVNIADARPAAVATPETRTEPVSRTTVWLHRLSLVILVIFCIELGMLLAVLPWTPVWINNGLLMARPGLKGIFQANFVRGVISGIGLVDIWIGIWEAVHYHDPA